ncbi:MAG: GNAT family N-acetyltransferase [Treponema sp.]|jgi:ribosomal protein S18 acetylase RimI-like enzyme|nr:GNAT family N-acetyltransferase [Treponema sp.]
MIKWKKIKNKDIPKIEDMLRDIEDNYVNACSRFLSMVSERDNIWMLCGKDNLPCALIIHSRSTLIPVLCGLREIPQLTFLKSIFQKKIHSVQGIKEEVLVVEKELEKIRKYSIDTYNYDLMSLDHLPLESGNNFSNLVLCVPGLKDLDELLPLRKGYEEEEVLPKGSVFSPAAGRAALINFITCGKILAAKLDGSIVGKIIVNAVSFTRYQIGGVYVLPEYRGRGIAKHMVREFITSLINEGKGITLFVKKNNIPARKLYIRLGFKVKGDYRITYY